MSLPATYLQLLSTVSEEGVLTMEMKEQPMPCLLYTSPSPRDGLLSRMPSSA